MTTDDKQIRVLLVEDEATLSMIICDTLTDEGFDIHCAKDGEEGLEQFLQHRPDIVVTDVMMPRMDGFEMVQRIRQTDRQTPVLFLTARSAVNDVVEGFKLGGNDYLRKPFGMQELIIRIKALVGRGFSFVTTTAEVSHLYTIGHFQFDSINQTLHYDDDTQSLSYRESEILKRLCNNRHQVVCSKDILLDLWGDDSFFNGRSLHVFITKLRHKLSKDEQVQIINVRGIGYKLV